MAQLAHHIACIALLILTASAKDQSRWSRQISSYTADISDWVPLPGPVEREPETKNQAAAEPRILSEPLTSIARATGFGNEPFPGRTFYNSPANRQLYLQSVPSVPSAPQNFLTEQGFGQGFRFGLSQPNFPLSQGFVAPQFGFESVPQIQPRPQAIPTTPVKFENFPKPGPAQTFLNPPSKKESPKFVDGYRAENTSNEYSFTANKKPQSLQKIKYDSFDKAPKLETTQGLPKVEREEVQLLYVPLESLNRGQFNFRNPIPSQFGNTDIYSQGLPRPTPSNQPTEFQRQIPKQIADTFAEKDYFTGFNAQPKPNYNNQVKDVDQVPKYSTIANPFPTYQSAPVTQKPKKLKPHQPPLAIFMTREESNNQLKVGDVLSSLKTAHTIAVLDSVNPSNAPKVFIGPSTLTPPDNYVKFELPYLSNIENSDKKLRQLPFFVAPLSYNTPQGFAKIPFPSPHVGSVVINSQIKEPQTPANTANVIPSVGPSVVPNIVQNVAYNSRQPITQNTYTQKPYKQEEKSVTQRPNFSYYSTAAPKPSQPNYHSKYYSVEPQAVSSFKTNEPEKVTTPKTGSYFLTNVGSQYNPTQYVNFQNNYKPEPTYTTRQSTTRQSTTRQSTTRRTTTTTQRPTTTSTKPSTFPSPLLETHNPYSINQAFHFSTPLDYHNYFEEYKESHAASGSAEISPSTTTTTTTIAPRVEEVTEKRYRQQSTPNYLQNYSPEIHYESEDQNSRFQNYNNVKYSQKTETTTIINEPVRTEIVEPTNDLRQTEYIDNTKTQSPVTQENPNENNNQFASSGDIVPPPNYEYTQYETSYNNEDISPITTTTTTTTTTTRRTPVRSRGRPRYTTARYESNEQQTHSTSTRRPLRERRPLPNRPRYDANKITTEKPTTEKVTRKPVESAETTTQYYTRSRTRGRVQFKPSRNEDYYEKKNRYNTKDEDLAYQRDVLHQNYPVTLMERGSTADIEAITESIPKISSTKSQETVTETFDTDNAYTNERLSVSQNSNDEEKDDIPVFTRPTQTEAPYIQRQTTRDEEYYYQSRSSLSPVQAISFDQEPITEKEELRETTPLSRFETDINAYVTEAPISATEADITSHLSSDESVPQKEDTTESLDIEIKGNQREQETENDEEENVVQTTPSYNRVRVRPGVVRQYHQASTESSRRRRPVQAVTYRPAFDRRRTTMRIEEIEADLKTKQVHSRPEVQDYKHPVYRPEPTTESSLPSTQETTTKRSFRRRRPNYSYSTTTTETTASTRRTYDVKNRFRGRRPTEKPTEKPELETDTPTTTVKTPAYSRYSHRPRLSERFNKKPEPEQAETEVVEEAEDQESNYSINRPKYVHPDDQWSAKVSGDSFKPFNPNDIVEENKKTVAEISDKVDDLDIITAKNEYDDILISVTPASNRLNKKLSEIPPTLEALVEQSKITKSDPSDSMSTFESMLEEVMKSLEEQDQDEYTRNVKKHKGGEIGEIPPERVITSGDNYAKTTTVLEQETTTSEPAVEDAVISDEEDNDRSNRRRGFWKKVKVRPATESIEFAESQYYQNTVNRLGQPIKNGKVSHEKVDKGDKNKLKVTTYKPKFQFIKDLFSDDESIPLEDILPVMDLSKLKKENKSEEVTTTEKYYAKFTNPGDLDLGTGTPDPTFDDFYYTTASTTINDRSDGFNFMDYLFGTSDEVHEITKRNETKIDGDIIIPTEQTKPKIATTETSYIPDEITAASEINTEIALISDSKRMETAKDKNYTVETSSISSFMDPGNVLSTSVSTQVSHETEICFRGKCIKTSKTVL